MQALDFNEDGNITFAEWDDGVVFGDLMNSIDQFVADEWVEALEEHKDWYKDPPNQNAVRKINKEL